MRASKFGLADLKRLRQTAIASDAAAAVGKPPAPQKKKRPQSKLHTDQAVARPAIVAHITAPPLAVNADSALSLDDQALFRQAVKSVQRIKDSRRAILPPTLSAPLELLHQRRAAAMGTDPVELKQVSDHYTPAQLHQDESSFVRANGSLDLIRGLKRGKWAIGASLDLHGATLEEARTRLDQFLFSCLTHHIKCVRIVHGKGYGSKDGTSVLKQTVRRWLTQLDAVSAYTECAEHDGGAGAVQVLLKTPAAKP